jgi:hypothetical protein
MDDAAVAAGFGGSTLIAVTVEADIVGEAEKTDGDRAGAPVE